MDDLRELVRIAERAAVIAGEVIMPLYESGTAVEWKVDATPVTEADRGAERAMRDFLAKETPGFGILGEEYGEEPGDGRHRWILDPIDGTKSFIHHVPLFGTLVALEVDDEPVVGVIACHAVRETVSAANGLGAYLNGAPARVSDTPDISDATVLMTSPRARTAEKEAGLNRLIAAANLSRTWGDCYGYLQVATGRADIMVDPAMNLWDVAAVAPVIREAGGTLTTCDGEKALGPNAVASNGKLHSQALNLLLGQ